MIGLRESFWIVMASLKQEQLAFSEPSIDFSRSLGRSLPKELVDRVVALPGTHNVSDIILRTAALTQWQNSLKKGWVICRCCRFCMCSCHCLQSS